MSWIARTDEALGVGLEHWRYASRVQGHTPASMILALGNRLGRQNPGPDDAIAAIAEHWYEVKQGGAAWEMPTAAR